MKSRVLVVTFCIRANTKLRIWTIIEKCYLLNRTDTLFRLCYPFDVRHPERVRHSVRWWILYEQGSNHEWKTSGLLTSQSCGIWGALRGLVSDTVSEEESTSYWWVEPLRMLNHLESLLWPLGSSGSALLIRMFCDLHLSQRVRALCSVFLSWQLLLRTYKERHWLIPEWFLGKVFHESINDIGDTHLILILLFSLSSSEERSWSEAEHHESSLLADCVEVLDLVASNEGCWCLWGWPTVSILVGPTSSHDRHLERGSSAKRNN